MKTVLAAALLVASATSAWASSGPSPLGQWSRGDGEARVRISYCGSNLCIINTWIRPGNNEEKVGDRLVLSVKPENGAHWVGEAFDPQRKLTYHMSFEVDRSSMESEGCVLGGLVCKSITWTRISS